MTPNRTHTHSMLSQQLMVVTFQPMVWVAEGDKGEAQECDKRAAQIQTVQHFSVEPMAKGQLLL